MSRKLTTTLEAKIYSLLSEKPVYRDNDLRLCARVWSDECDALGRPIGRIAAIDFLHMFVDDQITNSDSITRMRRKIQERHPELRGTLWKERHNESHKAQQELGYNV